MPARFGYIYDFGDGWEHQVLVVGPGGAVPGCVEGEGPYPPEDVGGPHGYAGFRKALMDPDDPSTTTCESGRQTGATISI